MEELSSSLISCPTILATKESAKPSLEASLGALELFVGLSSRTKPSSRIGSPSWQNSKMFESFALDMGLLLLKNRLKRWSKRSPGLFKIHHSTPLFFKTTINPLTFSSLRKEHPKKGVQEGWGVIAVWGTIWVLFPICRRMHLPRRQWRNHSLKIPIPFVFESPQECT